MGIPDHLTCLLQKLYAGQEATVKTGRGTTDCFKIGKGIHQGCILSPCLFNFYAEYIMRNAGLDESQAGRNQDCQEQYQQPQICRWYRLMAEHEEELKSLLMRVKTESEKAGLTFKKWSWHPVPSLSGKQKGKQWKLWQILFSWAPESLQTVTAFMKLRRLFFGIKAMTNLDGILKAETPLCWQRFI